LGVFVEELPYLGKILFYKTPYEGKMFQRKGQNERAWQMLLAFGKEVWYNKNTIGRCAITSRNTMWRTSNDTREERL
jgi:hypothetical protein